VHAVEFSKTAAPLEKGFLFRDAVRSHSDRLQTGPMIIAPDLDFVADAQPLIDDASPTRRQYSRPAVGASF
jgi:hypothetical protein